MSRGEAGFTLIELLVAMTAAALLLASLTWTVSRLGRQLEGRVGTGAAAEVAALRPVISSLMGGVQTGSDNGPDINRRDVRFVTAAPGAMGSAGRATVRLHVSGVPGDRHLEGVVRTDEDPPAERRFRSVHGWKDIAFSRIGEEDAPPVLKIDFTGNEDRQSIVAAARINTQGDCVFDPISMACRP
jgi:prepilin-type N-terminal cleavage/methylation domain-containing protein